MDKNLRIATHIKLLKQGEFSLLEDILLLEKSTLFDPDYYLEKYSGLKDSNVDPYYHYCLYGWRDGLEPSKSFSCEKYLLQNPEIKGVMSPLIHYLRYKQQNVIAPVFSPVCENVFLEIERLNKEKNSNAALETKCRKLQDVLTIHYRDLQPIPYFVSRSSAKNRRLILVTDALQKSLLGGVGTALILASKYACSQNMALLIVTRHSPAIPNSYFSFMELMHEKVPSQVDFYSDCDRNELGQKDFRLEIFPDDEFFTTSWWSTQAVKNMQLTNHKIFYIVQEVENYFYNYGDEHLLCCRLLSDSSPNLMFIVNSHYLWDYFKNTNRNIIENGIFFEPAFPHFLYRKGINTDSKRKFFFYCRKTHPRNLYYTGLNAVDLAIMRGILDPKEWDIYFAGAEPEEKIEFTDGTNPKYLGQLSWKEYADFISTVDLTFSLMYTPHPSYPPLDTIASGGVCVTNSFANKTSCEWSENLIFGDLTDEGLLKALAQGVKLACDDETRRKNFRRNSLPDSWDQVLQPVIAGMEKFRHG